MDTAGNEKKPRTGAFEITAGDKVIWSKLNGQGFPTTAQLHEAMKAAGFSKV